MKKKMLFVLLSVVMIFSMLFGISACAPDDNIVKYTYTDSQGETSYFEINFDKEEYTYSGNACYREGWGYMLIPNTRFEVSGYIRLDYKMNGYTVYEFSNHPWNYKYPMGITSDGNILRVQWGTFLYYDFVKEGYLQDENSGNNSNNNDENSNNNSEQQETTQTSQSIPYFVNDNSFGSITGEVNQTVKSYQNGTTVTAVAKDGYRFIGWSDGETEITRQDKIESDKEVIAQFELIYKFNFVAGEGGTIQGETYQEVGDGEKTTVVTAVANEGYEFLRWQYQQYQCDYYFWSETITVSSNDLTFSDTYTAIFKKVEYSAEYCSSYGGVIKYEYTPFDQNASNYNSNGVSSVTFTISIDNQFNAPQVTATPDANYRFVKWSDGNTSPTRQDLNLNGNLEVKAEFVRVYKFTFVAGEGGTIQGETYQEVDNGNYTTAVTAVANEGYEFWGWQYQQYNSDYYLWSETITVSSNNWAFGDCYTAIFKKV